VVLAHLDVVEARREDWSVDPFRLLEKEGFFFGVRPIPRRPSPTCRRSPSLLPMPLPLLGSPPLPIPVMETGGDRR
jgi:hypothetical protein